ncbi:TPA: GIY-YIG nuclease family protein, partial [Streptococcus suis]
TILPIIKKIFENMDESYSDYRENNLEKRYSIRPSQEIISQLKEKLTTYRQLSRGHSYTLEGIKENIKKLFVSLAPNV